MKILNKKYFPILCALLLFGAAGCIANGNDDDDSETTSTVDSIGYSVSDLLHDLANEGETSSNQPLREGFPQALAGVPAQAFGLNSDTIHAFEYNSVEDAIAAAATVSSFGTFIDCERTFGGVFVLPQFYIRDNLIVMHPNNGTPSLESLLGNAFAGFKLVTATDLMAGDGDDISAFFNRLEELNFTPVRTGPFNSDIFLIEGFTFDLGQDSVFVVEYATEEDALAITKTINPRGDLSIHGGILDFIGTTVNMFRSGKLVVLHAGSDLDLSGVLEQELGAPFAGSGVLEREVEEAGCSIN